MLFPSLRAYLNGEAVHVCTVNSTGPNATTQVTGVSECPIQYPIQYPNATTCLACLQPRRTLWH